MYTELNAPIMEALEKHIPVYTHKKSPRGVSTSIHPEYLDRMHEAAMIASLVDYNHLLWMLDHFMVPVDEIPGREEMESKRFDAAGHKKQLTEIWNKRKRLQK